MTILADNYQISRTHLNPGAFHGMEYRHDYEDGYLFYHINCKRNFSEDVYIPDIGFPGARLFSVLDKEKTNKVKSFIDSDDETPPKNFLDWIFTEELDGILKSYFKSYYVPLWQKFYKNMPNESSDRSYSFYWHFDAGPATHLKLLVYLNSAEESGGDTIIVDEPTSIQLKNIGYGYIGLDHRLSDLTELCKEFRIPYKPQSFGIKAGDCIIFEPAKYMHRGVWPTKAPRYLWQICLIPSPKPWKEACTNSNLPRSNNAWPKMT